MKTYKSFFEIDPRLSSFRTGDLALSCRDDLAGVFIMFFTGSLVEHSAIACWIDREQYTNHNRLVFKSRNQSDDILMFAHITKRRMFDHYTNTTKNGLVLCSLDEFVEKNLITVWKRGLSSEIKDSVALKCFVNYLKARSVDLEYENDIRTILGVPLNWVHSPYEHRKICTAMVCDYLSKSYGYPFLISRDGEMHNVEDLEQREVTFDLPSRDFAVYRGLDFLRENNKSPVFESVKEEIVYGYLGRFAKSTVHPINVIYVTVLGFLLTLLVFVALWKGIKTNLKSN